MATSDAPLRLTGEAQADALLSADPNALLIGMVLDQQVPMEKAFRGPAVVAERMGGRFDVHAIAAMGEEEFTALCSTPPAIHRFPQAMAKRVRSVCQILVERYDGDAANLWRDAATGAELKQRLADLPGFGEQKASIFVALLGKRRAVRPSGWREAAGPYGEDGVFRSVADIVDEESLARVRDSKRAAKAEQRQPKS